MLFRSVVVKNRLNLFPGTLRGQDIFPQHLLDNVFKNRLLLFFAERSFLCQDKAAAAGIAHEISPDFHFVWDKIIMLVPYLLF